jgi:DNA polymerase/3'-5' exonuclease PolX
VTNASIAENLSDEADRLERAGEANLYRIAAWRRAAGAVASRLAL